MSARSGIAKTIPLGRWREMTWSDLGVRALLWVPVGLAAIYLVLVMVKFTHLVNATNWVSDSSASYVIAQTLGDAPSGRHVLLGQFGWYTTLWFFLITKPLPYHRQIWEAAPYLFALLSAGLIAWACRRVAGARAAALAAVGAICASPVVLGDLFSPSIHTSTYFTVTVLGAYLVLLCTSRRARAGPWAVVGVLLVGTFAGTNAASDSLAWITAVAPLGLAAGLLWLLRPGATALRVAVIVLGMLAVTGVTAAITTAVMQHEGFRTAPPPALFASFDQFVGNIKLLFQVVLDMGNGYFFGSRVGGMGLLYAICAPIALAGAAVPIVAAVRVVRGRLVRAEPDNPGLGLTAFVLFWTGCALLVALAFVLSTAPINLTAARYALPLVYAVIATAAFLASRSRLAAVIVPVALSVFALTSVVGLARDTIELPALPVRYAQGDLLHIFKREHLKYGYAGYWEASSFTWQSKFAVNVYPVYECARPQAGTLCLFFYHRISSWYGPRSRTRTFLIVDPNQPFVTGPPDPAFGRPDRVYKVGPLSVYVYPQDIGRFFAAGSQPR